MSRAIAFLLLIFAARSLAATYYIDYVAGADSNAGSKTAPWKRHPFMRGWSGSYSAQSGDRFIFKGGVVWPSAALPLSPPGSGASGNPTYFGIDASWYQGTAWTRPVFDGEYLISSTINIGSLSWLTFEGLELKRITSSATSGYGLIQGGAPANILIKNCYLHGWRTSASADDAHGGLIMTNYGPSVETLVMEDSEIENSENQSRWNGVAVRMWGTLRRCKIHHNSSAVLFCLDFDGCDLYNICYPVAGFDGAYHWNGVYLDAKTLNKTVGYFRNSRVRDVSSGANMAYLNPRGAKIYCYNNVFWGEISDQRAIEVEPYNYGAGGTDGEAYVYNNTASVESGTPFIHVVNRGGNPKLAVLVARNNHVIGTNAGLHDGSGTTVGTLTVSNNLIQAPATAEGQGYTLSNLWAPTNASAPTVNAGMVISGIFDKDIKGVLRGTTWDIGAYEFGAGGNSEPVVSAITQNAADVDAASGLQVFKGMDVQYSATATDPNGDPLTWNWTSSVNGGAEVARLSGSGAVTPVSFSYAQANANDVYLWKLRVSDGKATTESSLTVTVIGPPPADQALTFTAESGQVTAPFTVQSGYIEQTVQTTLSGSGRAEYSFYNPVAGTYVLSANVNAPGDASNSIFFNIDAEPQDPVSVWHIPFTSGFEDRFGSWQGAGTYDNPELVPKTFTLTEGAHRLIIRGREAGVQVGRLKLIKVPEPPQRLRITQ